MRRDAVVPSSPKIFVHPCRMWIQDWCRGKKYLVILGAYNVRSVIYVFNTDTPLTLSTEEPQMQLKTGFTPAFKKEMGENRWCLLIPILSLANPHQCDPSLLKKPNILKMHMVSKLKIKEKKPTKNNQNSSMKFFCCK